MLTIVYKDGMTRLLNPHSDFFFSAKGHEKLTVKDLSEKVSSIVADFGPYGQLYKATLTRGSEVIVKIGPNLNNKPSSTKEVDTVDYSVQLKQMKKDSKNFKFTYKIVKNSEGVFVTLL